MLIETLRIIIEAVLTITALQRDLARLRSCQWSGKKIEVLPTLVWEYDELVDVMQKKIRSARKKLMDCKEETTSVLSQSSKASYRRA